MKPSTRWSIVALACLILASPAFAGPEVMRESKEVVPVSTPDCCNWAGFYIGVHAGGQFGNSENKDLDAWIVTNLTWSYDESGFVGGAQMGYNYQWHWLVLGAEADVGYMNLDGAGHERSFNTDYTLGETDSDFYTTVRGRVGFALNCWLFYATGGGIGVNYEKRASDQLPRLDARDTDFNWGYTVGGGIERKIGCHWSVKLEYLYFNLDEETFSGVDLNSTVGTRYRWQATTDGHIVRAGLNYKF